jgi:hypothetical protein
MLMCTSTIIGIAASFIIIQFATIPTTILPVLIFLFVLTTLYLQNKTYDQRPHPRFLIVKIITLLSLLLVYYAFLEKKEWRNVLTYVIIFCVVLNILETFPIQLTGKKSFPNIINIATGCLLCVGLLLRLVRSKFVFDVVLNKTQHFIRSNFGLLFILGYTFWNISFYNEAMGVDNIVIYASISLVIPLLFALGGFKDYLIVRTIALLFVILYIPWSKATFGVCSSDSVIKQFFASHKTKTALAIVALFFTLCDFVKHNHV